MSELQNLAAFLMADGCEWLTGETIAIDGAGYLATGAARLLRGAGQAHRRGLGQDARDDQGDKREGSRGAYHLMVMAPRPAATLILLREGMEVLMLQRTQNAAFLGGAYVFPAARSIRRTPTCAASSA